jgi:hypothetical protein
MNLLAETYEKLLFHELTPQDVLWIGSFDGKYRMTWQEFEVLANREYDKKYGRPEVCSDLVVVGDSWWLERHEYVGMEWWVFYRNPVGNSNTKPVTKIFGDRVE